jgi:hypothetical protein
MGGFLANRNVYNGFYYKPVSLGVANLKNGCARVNTQAMAIAIDSV